MKGRRSTLPGIWGPLTGALGGMKSLADYLGTSPRDLHNWAHGVSEIPAIEADLANDLRKAHGITPQLFVSKHGTDQFIASLPAGWMTWDTRGYARRRRYRGNLEGLEAANQDVLRLARTHGWPW